jgi:predicted membrane-bound spermidine synthase
MLKDNNVAIKKNIIFVKNSNVSANLLLSFQIVNVRLKQTSTLHFTSRFSSLYKKIALPNRYAKLLYRTCLHFGYQSCLELGTGTGGALAYLSCIPNLSGCVSVDAHPIVQQKVADVFYAQKVNVNFVSADFKSFLNHNEQVFDFVFLDSTLTFCCLAKWRI